MRNNECFRGEVKVIKQHRQVTNSWPSLLLPERLPTVSARALGQSAAAAHSTEGKVKVESGAYVYRCLWNLDADLGFVLDKSEAVPVCRSQWYCRLYQPIHLASSEPPKRAVRECVCISGLVSFLCLHSKLRILYEDNRHSLSQGRSLQVSRHEPWRGDNTTAWNLKQGMQSQPGHQTPSDSKFAVTVVKYILFDGENA